MNLLTHEQLNALATCKIMQNVLIVANAGTGKTIVAVEYVKWLRSTGLQHHEILFVSFSNKLAEHIR